MASEGNYWSVSSALRAGASYLGSSLFGGGATAEVANGAARGEEGGADEVAGEKARPGTRPGCRALPIESVDSLSDDEEEEVEKAQPAAAELPPSLEASVQKAGPPHDDDAPAAARSSGLCTYSTSCGERSEWKWAARRDSRSGSGPAGTGRAVNHAPLGLRSARGPRVAAPREAEPEDA